MRMRGRTELPEASLNPDQCEKGDESGRNIADENLPSTLRL